MKSILIEMAKDSGVSGWEIQQYVLKKYKDAVKKGIKKSSDKYLKGNKGKIYLVIDKLLNNFDFESKSVSDLMKEILNLKKDKTLFSAGLDGKAEVTVVSDLASVIPGLIMDEILNALEPLKSSRDSKFSAVMKKGQISTTDAAKIAKAIGTFMQKNGKNNLNSILAEISSISSAALKNNWNGFMAASGVKGKFVK